MGYAEIALLAGDTDFSTRTAACVAVETESEPTLNDPYVWARNHSWKMAAQPGFGDKYASAIAGSVERPGNDPSVISDGEILAAVQAIHAEETTPATGG